MMTNNFLKIDNVYIYHIALNLLYHLILMNIYFLKEMINMINQIENINEMENKEINEENEEMNKFLQNI